MSPEKSGSDDGQAAGENATPVVVGTSDQFLDTEQESHDPVEPGHQRRAHGLVEVQGASPAPLLGRMSGTPS